MTLSFENTEVAFASKNLADLRRAQFLFRMIGHKHLVDVGKILTQLAFGLHLPINPLIKATLFRQFVGGETITDCESTIATLAKYKIGAILDYSAEGVHSESGFENTTQELLRILDYAKDHPHIPFGVFKVSGLAPPELLEKVSQQSALTLAESSAWERVQERVVSICQRAYRTGTPVLIDAEETWLQPAIDKLVETMMQQYNRERVVVYHTLQMYRHDRLAYLQALIEQGQQADFYLGFKLVRGAYMEKERQRALNQGYADPIQPDKAGTDRDYDAAVSLCLKHVERVAVCAGTHNEASTYHLVQEMQQRHVPPTHAHIWFAQLLGMSDHISFNLAQAGYRVVKYVPYAPVKEIVPYLIRRAEENTSVAGQTSRELALIEKELTRRRLNRH